MLKTFVISCIKTIYVIFLNKVSTNYLRGGDNVTRKDWLLLVVCAAGSKGLSALQLQKSLFLLGEKMSAHIGNYYKFTPYDYGPFDSNIYRDAEGLSRDNLISIRQSMGQRWVEYTPTSEGISRAHELEKNANPKALAYLNKVVDWIKNLSFAEILQAVYKAYPSYKVNSVFKDT
jgi:hypothetical protein